MFVFVDAFKTQFPTVLTLELTVSFLFFRNNVMFSSMSHERTSLNPLDVKQGRSALKTKILCKQKIGHRLCNTVP